MTERERLLEKIRKVQALANRGADGEKQSAAALLDKLMTQYGIDEAEIAEERLEKCFFRYKTPYERKLLVQVIYTVTGKIPFKCVGSYSGRARKQVGIDCTAAERLEIEFSYEFYKAALEEEMERFYSAFLMKNDIFPPASKKAEEIPAAEISRSEALKLQALMAGMGDHTRRLQCWTVAKWALRICGWAENVLLGVVILWVAFLLGAVLTGTVIVFGYPV